jgi:hypothetical protein
MLNLAGNTMVRFSTTAIGRGLKYLMSELIPNQIKLVVKGKK